MTRLEKLQEFLKADPKDSFTCYAIGLEYLSAKDLPKAAEMFEALIVSDPAYVATYYQLGDCYRQLNEKEKAASCYKNGITQARAVNDLHTVSELQMVLDELEDE